MHQKEESRDERNKRLRSERLAIAREKGRHSKQEWQALVAEFSARCVRCGTDDYRVEKDHIQPIYQGGSDAIENIQPCCARCNSRKGPESFNWAEYRRAHGFDRVGDGQ